MAENNIFINFILIGAVILSLIFFGVSFGNDNQTKINLDDSPVIANITGDLNASLSGISSQTSKDREAFEKEKPTLSSGSLLFGSIVGIGKTVTATLSLMLRIITYPVMAIIGINPLIVALIISTIILGVIFYLWRIYKTG